MFKVEGSLNFTRRRFIKTVSVAASVAALGGMSSKVFGQAKPEPIKIGCSLALTGQMAAEGHQFREGYQFMAKYINDTRGGITLKGAKRPLELIIYDDQSETKTAVKLVEKLISDEKIDLILGPYSSGIVYSVGGVIRKYNKIMLEGGGISERIFKDYNTDKKYIFLTSPSTGLMCKPIIEWMKSVGVQKVALLSEKGEFSRSMRDEEVKLMEQHKLDLVLEELVALDARDFTPTLGKIKQAKPDALLSNSHLELGIRFVKQMRDLDVNVKAIYGGSAVEENEYFKSLGWMGNGVTYYAMWDPRMKFQDPWFSDTQGFIEVWKKAFNAEPTARRASGASSVQIFAMAIEGANSVEPDALRDYLSKVNSKNFLGPIAFDELAKLKRSAFLGQRLGKQGENINIIYPPEMANAKALYPRPSWKELEALSKS